jgi:chemotaxis protein methyltransferase CheR
LSGEAAPPTDTPPTDEPALRAALRRVPGVRQFARAVKHLEHAFTLRFARRRNYIFTKFCRLPAQLDVLATDVVDFVRSPDGSEIRIIVFGCSIGAEPYSIASVLRTRRPDVAFRMECFDIEPAVIARAEAARYDASELETSPPLTPDFVASTFDRVDDMGGVVVKPEIARSVRFAVGNVLDASLIERIGRADIVVAQNFLYHLPRPEAERGFANLVALLRPRAALLVDGADMDMRARVTDAAGLRPCTTDLERIHGESRIERGYAWPRVYWGLEPFDARRSDAARRFATIFFSER